MLRAVRTREGDREIREDFEGARPTIRAAQLGRHLPPRADGVLRAGRRRIRGKLRFLITCARLLRPARARVRDRRCPSRSGRGKASPRAIAGEELARASSPRWPLVRRQLGQPRTERCIGCPRPPCREIAPGSVRGVVGRSVAVLENRGGCRSRHALLRCVSGAGAHVDGRRLGLTASRSLTGARRDRSSPSGPAGSGGTGGVRGLGFERCARPRTPAQRSAAPVRRSSFAHRPRWSVGSPPEAGGSASNEPPPASRAPRGVREAGIERLLRCSSCRSVAEVGERHLYPRCRSRSQGRWRPRRIARFGRSA
jgi:hypothetical protein